MFSDYRFRGFTQTDYKPAFQGGFDFAHKSGFYVGNWNSNVEQLLFNGASLEMDFYGGYKTTFGDFGLDVGLIYYYYPGTGEVSPGVDADNFEFYIGGSYGPVSVKYFYSFTDFFGLHSDAFPAGTVPPGVDTKGSQYLDLTATFPFDDGCSVVAHVGCQKVENYAARPDRRRRLRLQARGNYDIVGSGWIAGLAVVGTSEKSVLSVGDLSEGGGKTRAVVSISKTF